MGGLRRMRNRCILSSLACFVLLYYAWPRLDLNGSGLPFYFSLAWLMLLLFAIAGNFAGILFAQVAPKRKMDTKGKKIYERKARTYQN